MTNTIQEKIAVMQAFADGERIECRRIGSDSKWEFVSRPVWDWHACVYRVAVKNFEVGGKYEWLSSSPHMRGSFSGLKCVYVGGYQGVFETALGDLATIATEHLRTGDMRRVD